MTHECKFCGKRFNAAYFISKKEYTADMDEWEENDETNMDRTP